MTTLYCMIKFSAYFMPISLSLSKRGGRRYLPFSSSEILSIFNLMGNLAV